MNKDNFKIKYKLYLTVSINFSKNRHIPTRDSLKLYFLFYTASRKQNGLYLLSLGTLLLLLPQKE